MGVDIDELFGVVPGEGKLVKGLVKKIRFRDKSPELQKLGKYLGLLKDRVEVEDVNATRNEEAHQAQL